VKVEFAKIPLPTKPDELGPYLEAHRTAFLESENRAKEAEEKLATNIEAGAKSIEEHKRQATKLAEMEELLKTLHEQNRIHGDGGIERQLRTLPMVRRVEKDQDYRGRVPSKMFNLLALTRDELKTYLSGEALNWALRFRRLNNAVLSTHHIMSIVSEGAPQRREQYAQAGGIKGTELFPALQECYKQGMRALDIAEAGHVAEWIPTLYSSDRFTEVRDQLQLAQQFRWLPMPQSPWVIPTLTGFMTAYVIPEANNNAAAGNTILTESDPTSSNRTLTAKKLAVMSYFSREVEQDSIVAVLPMYDEEMAYAQAFGIENAVVNGQLTATIDTGSAPGATDVRANFDGVRFNASLIGSTVDFSAGMTAERLAQMIQVLGKWADPNNCVFATGYTGLAKALILKDGNGNLVYLTREHAGDAATMFTGAVGILMGYPLVISGAYPQNMNLNGVIDGVTTTKTGIVLLNKRPWLGGNRQGVEVEVSRDERFSYDQIGVRSIQRAAFRALIAASAAKPHLVAGVGL